MTSIFTVTFIINLASFIINLADKFLLIFITIPYYKYSILIVVNLCIRVL